MPDPVDELAPRSHVLVHHRIDGTAHRKNRQPVGEGEERQDGQPEIRHGEKEQRDAAQDVISRGPAPRHLHQCDQYSEGEAPNQRDAHEQERVRERVREDITHWPVM